MANWYNRGKKDLAGAFNWVSGDYRCLLVDSTYAFVATHNVVSDVSAKEIAVANYVRKVFGTKSVSQDDTNSRAALIAASITWTALGAGVTIGGAVVYLFNAADASADLVAFIDTNDLATAGNDVTLNLDATAGVLQIT